MMRLLLLSCAIVLIASPAAAQESVRAAPTLVLAMTSDALSESLGDRYRVAPPVAPPGGGRVVTFATPTLRVFDAAGHELLSIIGYDAPTFLDSLATLTARPATEALTLTTELGHTLADGGVPVDVGALPATDYTFVQYGTESCPPCHAETAAIAAFLGARPDLSVTWIDVEIDFSAVIAGEAMTADG